MLILDGRKTLPKCVLNAYAGRGSNFIKISAANVNAVQEVCCMHEKLTPSSHPIQVPNSSNTPPLKKHVASILIFFNLFRKS